MSTDSWSTNSDPPPFLIGATGAGFAPLAEDSWRRALGVASDQAPLSAQARLAYDIYSASFFVSASADSRFMLLMMALETLMEQQERNAAAREHVDALIDLTRESDLADTDKKSMLGSLARLKKESVTQAGKRLAGSLRDRSYGDIAPGEFFAHCYDIRSQLVHGHIPRPSRQEVGALAARLEGFVGDLIAGPAVLEAIHTKD